MSSSFDTTLTNLGITNSSSAQNAVAASSKTAQLGQSDFIALLTAQLKNQDPFAPVDATQQVTQLAQFSSVAGISEINTTLKSIQSKLEGTSTSDALAYVGHNVLTEGNTAYPRTTGGVAGAIELDADATEVNVSIQSADGQVLKTLKLGPHGQGTVNFDWDGTTNSGADAGAGPFNITAVAADAGKTVVSHSLVWAPVSSVSVPSTGPAILSVAGIGQIPVTAVRQVG